MTPPLEKIADNPGFMQRVRGKVRQYRASLYLTAGISALAPACGGGGGGGSGGTAPPPPGQMDTICFYDGAETSYNRTGNPDIMQKRVKATGMNVNGTAMGADHCALVDAGSTVSYGGGGFAQYSVSLNSLDPSVYRDGNEWFFFAIPQDLVNKGYMENITGSPNNFSGWPPGSQIKYRTITSSDKNWLESAEQNFWKQLQPIDLDPYNDDGSIVKTNANAQPGNGVVRMEQGSWQWVPTGIPPFEGGTIYFLRQSPNRSKGTKHETAHSIGMTKHGPTGTLFGLGGAENLLPDEARALRLTNNLAGHPVP